MRSPKEEFQPGRLNKTQQEILVWVAISIHGTTNLQIIEGSMNQLKYIDVLKNNLIPQTREWFGEKPWKFQQNWSCCHNARSVKEWCTKNNVELMPWPDRSSDMNPIDALWSTLKDEVNNVPSETRKALEERLKHVWFNSAKIKHSLETLIGDMPERVKALKVANGRLIKHNLAI